MNSKKFLLAQWKVKQHQNQYRPIKGYTRDTIAKNLYNSFVTLFPDGSPSEALTKYAITKIRILPAYPIR